jgi:hypothetical protein
MEDISRKCNGKPYIYFGELDANNVIQQLAILEPELWNRYDFRSKATIKKHIHNNKVYEQATHKNTQTIPLLWQRNGWVKNDPISILKFKEYESLFYCIDYLHNFLKQKGVEDGIIVTAMFAKLLPKKIIPPHSDKGNILVLCHRYHWIISSDLSVEFTVNGHTNHWPNNHVYELNNRMQHSVNNKSDKDRIHFIMDIIPYSYISSNDITYQDIDSHNYSIFEPILSNFS